MYLARLQRQPDFRHVAPHKFQRIYIRDVNIARIAGATRGDLISYTGPAEVSCPSRMDHQPKPRFLIVNCNCAGASPDALTPAMPN